MRRILISPVASERPEILDSFKTQGLRYTSQRYAILRYLRNHRSHPTVEEIYKAINVSNPRASRATVYNGLHALVGAGLIREVNLSGHATRYESHIQSHHHFICESCGGIEDLEWFEIPDLGKRAKADPRTVRVWELVLRGSCESCLSQRKEELKWEK